MDRLIGRNAWLPIFSEIQQYEPCKLCWYQRILMYPIVLITTVAYIQKMHVLL